MKTLYVSLAVLLLIAQHGSAQWKGFTHLDNPMAAGMIDTSLFISQQGSNGHTYRYSATWPGPPYGLIESDSDLPYGTVISFGYLAPTYFVGTSDRGVFRSTDQGKHWILCRVGVGTTCFATIGTVVFAGGTGPGGGSGGIYRSMDQGNTWEEADMDTAINRPVTLVHALAVVGSDLFAAADAGVFRSTDSGRSWTLVNSQGGALAITAAGANVYCVEGPGIFRSTNMGDTWTETDKGVTGYINSIVTDGKNLFVGTGFPSGSSGQGVFRSSDSGDTWDTVNANLPYQVIVGLIVFDTNLIANVNTY